MVLSDNEERNRQNHLAFTVKSCFELLICYTTLTPPCYWCLTFVEPLVKWTCTPYARL